MESEEWPEPDETVTDEQIEQAVTEFEEGDRE